MSIHDGASAPVTLGAIAEVLGETRALGDGRLPASAHDRVMARKRALIERIQPGFYDQPDSAPVPEDQPVGDPEVADDNSQVQVDGPRLAERITAVWQWLEDSVPWGDHLATDGFRLRGRTTVRNLVVELRHVDLDSGGGDDA